MSLLTKEKALRDLILEVENKLNARYPVVKAAIEFMHQRYEFHTATETRARHYLIYAREDDPSPTVDSKSYLWVLECDKDRDIKEKLSESNEYKVVITALRLLPILVDHLEKSAKIIEDNIDEAIKRTQFMLDNLFEEKS